MMPSNFDCYDPAFVLHFWQPHYKAELSAMAACTAVKIADGKEISFLKVTVD